MGWNTKARTQLSWPACACHQSGLLRRTRTAGDGEVGQICSQDCGAFARSGCPRCEYACHEIRWRHMHLDALTAPCSAASIHVNTGDENRPQQTLPECLQAPVSQRMRQ